MNGEHVTRSGIGHRGVRACSDCWGPVARCPACRRAHCDDTGCPGCPIACAEALDAGPDATLADPTPPRSHP